MVLGGLQRRGVIRALFGQLGVCDGRARLARQPRLFIVRTVDRRRQCGRVAKSHYAYARPGIRLVDNLQRSFLGLIKPVERAHAVRHVEENEAMNLVGLGGHGSGFFRVRTRKRQRQQDHGRNPKQHQQYVLDTPPFDNLLAHLGDKHEAAESQGFTIRTPDPVDEPRRRRCGESGEEQGRQQSAHPLALRRAAVVLFVSNA